MAEQLIAKSDKGALYNLGVRNEIPYTEFGRRFEFGGAVEEEWVGLSMNAGVQDIEFYDEEKINLLKPQWEGTFNLSQSGDGLCMKATCDGNGHISLGKASLPPRKRGKVIWSGHSFSADDWAEWGIQKKVAELAERVDRVYKTFDINLIPDDLPPRLKDWLYDAIYIATYVSMNRSG